MLLVGSCDAMVYAYEIVGISYVACLLRRFCRGDCRLWMNLIRRLS